MSAEVSRSVIRPTSMKLRIANCMQAGHDDHTGVIDAVVEAVDTLISREAAA